MRLDLGGSVHASLEGMGERVVVVGGGGGGSAQIMKVYAIMVFLFFWDNFFLFFIERLPLEPRNVLMRIVVGLHAKCKELRRESVLADVKVVGYTKDLKVFGYTASTSNRR